jgi:transient receptor potential cation channel subfamily C member 4
MEHSGLHIEHLLCGLDLFEILRLVHSLGRFEILKRNKISQFSSSLQRDARRGFDPYIPREFWDPFDPMLISEGAFAAGMIFSFLKLVHIFSINPHMGPLQVSLGRMIIDIIKFFFIYTLVLFAFGCGMNQLLWYYAELEMQKCYHLPNGLPDFDDQEKACTIWRRFAK